MFPFIHSHWHVGRPRSQVGTYTNWRQLPGLKMELLWEGTWSGALSFLDAFAMLEGTESHGIHRSERVELVFLWRRSELEQANQNRSNGYVILESWNFNLKAVFSSSLNTTEHWFVIDLCKETTFHSHCSLLWALGRCALIKYWLSLAYLQETS